MVAGWCRGGKVAVVVAWGLVVVPAGVLRRGGAWLGTKPDGLAQQYQKTIVLSLG
jgi:hypothetical protein